MTNKPKHVVGDDGPGGQKIAHIFGHSDSVLVYRDEEHDLHYYTDAKELSDSQREAIRIFHDVSQQVFSIWPKSSWKHFQNDMGGVLFDALIAPNTDDVKTSFTDLQLRVIETSAYYRRLQYSLAALAASLLLGLIFFLLYQFYPVVTHRIYALCLVFAFAGAVASVIQRVSNIPVGEREEHSSLWLRGACRIITGGLLAAFFVVASKANLALGISANSPWVLLAFSFISGFSERFVPDLIAHVEREHSADGHPSRRAQKKADKAN